MKVQVLVIPQVFSIGFSGPKKQYIALTGRSIAQGLTAYLCWALLGF